MNSMIVTLDRFPDESVSEYDNRINAMEPFCVGQAYFRSINYDASRHLFSVFIVWNDINNKLLDPMPSGGFQVHCSEKDAMLLCRSYYGFDAYARLVADDGDVFFKDIYVLAEGKRLVISFTGCKTIEPEIIPVLPAADKQPCIIGNQIIKGNYKGYTGSYNLGSFNLSSFSIGSFRNHLLRLGSFNVTSFNVTSFNVGSFRRGAFGVSSYVAGSYNIFWNDTSFNYGSFGIGSFNLFENLNSYNTGSFDVGSFSLSSFNLGSYNNWRMGSGISAMYGSAMGMSITDIPYFDLLNEIFGIGMLGYGLDNL